MTVPPAWSTWHKALFERVGALEVESLDEATRRRAALVLVDDLAAMAAAADEPEVVALGRAATRLAPQRESSTVVGPRVGRAWAGLVNAVAANWHELDEGYRPATCHGGLYALPAAMAEVEASGGTLGELMVALVAGYEVATAYARAFPPSRPLVLHPHATLSPVGAAAAVAKARGIAGPGVRAAAQVAITLAAAGPFGHATSGVLVRNGWPGHGTLSGFSAVEFAAAGITGADASAVAVLHEALGNPPATAELEASQPRWAIHDGYHKQFACCQYAHSAVEACLDLRAGALKDLDPARIRRIVVEEHPLAMSLDDHSPRTVLGGKFSVPHVVAAVLVTGRASAAVFGPGGLNDREVERVRQLVEMVPYQGSLVPPFDRPARVSVEVEGAGTFVAVCTSAVGGTDRPLSDREVLEKAEGLTQASFPAFAESAESLVSGTTSLDANWGSLLETMWSR